MRLRYYNINNIDSIGQLKVLGSEHIEEMKLVAQVIPFRVNNFIIEEMIDWDKLDDDPIFKLAFPHKDLLKEEHYTLLEKSRQGDNYKEALAIIRSELNPHPSEQKLNIPTHLGKIVDGVQHKYDETILLFPKEGQTCHTYCNFCFRWPQFIGDSTLKFETDRGMSYLEYIKDNKLINDVLITGGDPMVMSAEKLTEYIVPLLSTGFDHIKTIRIGSKSLTYWPNRYISDKDTEQILKLFEKVIKSGKHLAFMAHFNHWRELENEYVKKAVKNIQATGAIIRSQSPILNNINNSSDIWAKMWKIQYQLGIIPYYMFVERNTGADHYYSLPLYEAYNVYTDAIGQVSGLCRTVRGPSMSAAPGKVNVVGVTTINKKKYFVLKLIQSKQKKWLNMPFLAKFDHKATWLDQLQPAFSDEFFFKE